MSFLDIPEPVDEELSHFSSANSLRQRSAWFIKLRTMAVVVSVLLVLIAKQVLPALNWINLFIPIAALAFVNFLYWLANQKIRLKSRRVERFLIKIQMLVDLVILTILIHFSGGIENPMFFVYFIHLILASLMFPGKQVYQIAFLAIILFTGEVLLSLNLFGEKFSLFDHHHVFSHANYVHDGNYIFLMLGMFWFVILFTAFVTSSMMNRYRITRDKLVQQQKQLIETEKEKIDFFRFATHEMKTPVITVQSALDTILAISSDTIDSTSKNLITSSLVRTQQAIDIVKDLGEMTQGTIPDMLEKSNLDLTETIRNIVDGEMLNNQKKIKVTLNLPDDGFSVNISRNLFEKIMINLVSNAIRYNRDNGEIIITLTPGKMKFNITVQDFGIGMTLKQQEKIFTEFYRTPEAKKHTKIGTGLGMSIVKRFIEKLDGRITVKSAINKGTIFNLEIPTNV